MSNFKFSPDLFLEVAELNRLSNFLDKEGFRKNIIENSISYGLIKSNADKTFANGLVQRDIDSLGGDKTIKIAPVHAIDNTGKFIYSPQTINQIPLINDGNWYWLKVRHEYSNIELGTVSIAVNGDLVGSGTEFTKILRGQPNFPSRIKLVDSDFNTLEYDVLEVTDDTHAILGNPAANVSGFAEFEPENDLHFAIVGTFTPGISVPSNNKYPFQYDSMYYELVKENVLNTRPTPYIQGQEFYIARILISGSNVIIQDKRIEYWETKGSEIAINIERGDNKLVGVETVKWQVPTNPSDKNIVEVGWGMRSSNWSINSSQNILVINSGLGGKYKTVNDFNNGDFNGWRVYTGNGKYSNVINSVKQGGAINLTLDVLDVDNYSIDGGNTFIQQTVTVVPNCENVEFWCQSNPADSVPSVSEVFSFPVNDLLGRIELEVYNTTVYYNIQYRYKSFKEYSQWRVISTDTVNGYLTEVSFDNNGNLKPSGDQVRFKYTQHNTNGFIKLNQSPWSYNTFKGKVDKGDLIGVTTITNLSSLNTYNLVVGISDNYQYISGSPNISGDVFFNLSTAGAVEGNEFRIHFNCTKITLNGNNILITQGLGGGSGVTTLKKIAIGDVYSMLNQDGGICFDCKYTGNKWVVYQNYNNGTPFEIKQLDGVISDLFDTTSSPTNAMGKVKGLYGYVLCNNATVINGVNVPNLSYSFLLGDGTSPLDNTKIVNVGQTGGEIEHQLTINELPEFTPQATQDPHSHEYEVTFGESYDGGTTPEGVAGSGNDNRQTFTWNTSEVAPDIEVESIGGGQKHNNMPPYYTVIFAKKLY